MSQSRSDEVARPCRDSGKSAILWLMHLEHELKTTLTFFKQVQVLGLFYQSFLYRHQK